MKHNILVLNPGSTSTKVAVFENDVQLFQEVIRHDPEVIKTYDWCMDQVDFRREIIEQVLRQRGFDLNTLSAIASRGGRVPPCPSGAYAVNQVMVDYMYTLKKGAHVSNIGCVIAYQMAQALNIPSYIYDPVGVDELIPLARISGMPEIPRIVVGHALNTRAMAMKCCREILHKPFEQSTLIVAHIGGGISVRLIHNGRNIDANNDDNGGMSPERAGCVSAEGLIQLCYSGKYTEAEMIKKIRGNGGLKAHLGTTDAREVEARIEAGDKHAKLVYDAMALSIAKDIAQMAVMVGGKVDRIILTGGVAYSDYIRSYIEEKVSFIAPVENMAGEYEMEALAEGILRVLENQEQARDFSLESYAIND